MVLQICKVQHAYKHMNMSLHEQERCARNLKNCFVDFHKICTAGTSKLVDVQCKFMFKSDNKILSYGRF